MRWLRRIGFTLSVLVVVAVAWLALAPPALLRIGTGYAAKIVCSNVFVAGRDAGAVLADDVQAPGNPILRAVTVAVDRPHGRVEARLLHLFAPAVAVHRPGLGCASIPAGPEPAGVPAVAAPPPDDGALPSAPDRRVAALLARDDLAGPGMRAVVVVQDGRIVGERYGSGFDAATPLLGWSMTKTVTAALVGTALARVGPLDRARLRPEWSDARARIRLSDLMAMASGLRFVEDYGGASDANRMLFLKRDMAGYAAAQPLVAPPGTRWSYSSGTATLLMRLLQDRFATPAEAQAWPRRALFAPLGMASAVMEADASGTLVGGSYMYATARDWARFGQLLVDDGVWRGRRLLPAGYVGWMRRPTPVSGGRYGRQIWVKGPPGPPLPADAFWMLGHDGQSVAILPLRRLVVVRLGLTPSRGGWSPTPLVAAIAALRRPGQQAPRAAPAALLAS